MQLQEFVAGSLPPLLESHRGDVVVGNAVRDTVELAQTCYVGNRLDVENKDRRHYFDVHAPALFW